MVFKTPLDTLGNLLVAKVKLLTQFVTTKPSDACTITDIDGKKKTRNKQTMHK